ncbi:MULTISPECIES: hypothetical protein [unclassified Streptomyces]|uniref:hypothetical protein n=1 Tax=unclassified Streptomyces TaxID=2593676 RepID=UPI00093E739D|nr:hypothetical protein [Streptomyces sp. TSRI0107]OKJ90789.1 hypothetical protein AMK31_03515 [Streptomyces sp. TSRI0107]
MSTGLIVALIVIGAVVVIGAAVLLMQRRGATGGRDLKRRFGPEYERTVARHDGDTKAAERELAGRVERHGGLRERPLEAGERGEFEARWQAAQERFVDSPRQAVTEADLLLAELAGARGFPDGGQYEEQLAALSVHHAAHVHGYRRVHRLARADGGAGQAEQGTTEEMREAMVEARALFEDLVSPNRRDHDEPGDRRPPHHARRGRSHLPWGFTRHHAKGS